eukprot:7300959-Prymnesium_polylepis.1
MRSSSRPRREHQRARHGRSFIHTSCTLGSQGPCVTALSGRRLADVWITSAVWPGPGLKHEQTRPVKARRDRR